MRIVLHCAWGGFGSGLADKFPGMETWDIVNLPRTDPRLVDAVAGLESYRIVEIPDGAHYVINDYDDMESLYWSDSLIHLG